MVNGILSQTRNFLTLYMHNCGHSETPSSYNFWTGVSLIAACLGRNVWIQKTQGRTDDPLYPNMYIFLLGESSIGKDTAINRAMKLIRPFQYVNYFKGDVTKQALIDHMVKTRIVYDQPVDEHTVFLVTPELASSISSGPMADRFIKFLTGIYGGSDVPYMEATRMHGQKQLNDPCVNWIAGSTPSWLLDSVPPEDIMSGFFARVIAVYEEKDFSILEDRVPHPSAPPDFAEVQHHLETRVAWMCHRARGQFRETNEAKDVYSQWYKTRPGPESQIKASIWRREAQNVQKLAMVFSMADMLLYDLRPGQDPDLVIEARHIIEAQKHLSMVNKHLDKILTLANVTSSTRHIGVVKERIQTLKKVRRSSLMRAVLDRGVSKGQMDEAIYSLMESQQVDQAGAPGSISYVWRGGKHHLGEVQDET